MKVFLKMTKNASQLSPKSILSEQTEASARFESVVVLGKKIVEELGLEPSVDTLGRWMAHHVAELIENAEFADGEPKNEAQRKCLDAILALWRHRAELPNGKRPYEDLEVVIRAVQSLDPEDSTPRYFRNTPRAEADNDENNETKSYLEMVAGLDYSAKILIGFFLAEAARATADKSKEWVTLAEAAGADDGVSEIVIRFVTGNDDLRKEIDESADSRRVLQERISRLEGFIKLSYAVVEHLKSRLQQ